MNKTNAAAKNIFIALPALCALTSEPSQPLLHPICILLRAVFVLPPYSLLQAAPLLEITQQVVCLSKEVLILSPNDQSAVNLT